MSLGRKLALLFVYIVIAILTAIDWAMIYDVIGFMIPQAGDDVARAALSGLFIAAITIIPVFPRYGLSSRLIERTKENRMKRWTGQSVDRTDSVFFACTTTLFLGFAITFLVMSVNFPERFIIAMEDPASAMFGLTPVIAELSNENAVLAAWIAGFIPLATSLVSIVIHFFVSMESKKELMEREIRACNIQIARANAKIDRFDTEISVFDGEKVLLQNLTKCVDEIKTHINDYVKNKDDFVSRSKAKHVAEKEKAHDKLSDQSRINLNNFFELGRQKFAPAIRGNPEKGKPRLSMWDRFYEESKSKVEATIDGSGGKSS